MCPGKFRVREIVGVLDRITFKHDVSGEFYNEARGGRKSGMSAG